ncbi:MAG: site-specific tyrosine recombinase XerD [Lachnospiraceae bacterium]|nr:site-specific tyrosine recombinase XerD [Lachnospiraceae bacterium]
MCLELPLFIDYLKEQKNASESTVDSYQRDLRKLESYLIAHGVEDVENVTTTNLNSYILYLEKQGMSTATVSRSVASMKAFFHYIYRKHEISDDPTETIKAPHIEKKLPGILSVEETARLLEQPSGRTPKELRDRAMLELLYATGMRVTELISLRMDAVRLNLNFVSCCEGEKERVIPFGDTAKNAIKRYLEDGRDKLLKGKESEYLFVNCSGNRMTRQGFWKLVKSYASKAGITSDITPQTLRHSFAAHLLQNGAPVESVQEMLGHADISTTQNYLKLGVDRMQRVYHASHPRG